MKLIPRDDFFLDDVFSDFLSSKDTNSFKCDIYEKEGKYYIELDTPGCSKEDTSIECDNGYLTVKVSKKMENNDEGKNYIRRERSTKEYSRSFYVGDVDTDKIKANFKNGCLTIEVPKEEKIETKKTIQIEE
jgi:HSP20 family protein